MKTQLFSYPSYAKNTFCFTLSLHWWYSIPSLDWFEHLLDHMKEIFLKFVIRWIRKISNENSIFFPGKLCQNFFFSPPCITLVIILTEFGLIYTSPWPHERIIFKICYSLNSQNSVWKPDFFPRQAMPNNFFALEFCYIGDTPNWVWVDLNNSLITWKRTIFKIHYSLNSKNSVWKPNFFPRQAMPKRLFALHSH